MMKMEMSRLGWQYIAADKESSTYSIYMQIVYWYMLFFTL